ncbi:MAG: helix-turn-helix domain-containing protein [Armatimonadota bacterium]
MVNLTYIGSYPFHTPQMRIRGIGVAERVSTGALVRPTGTPDYLIAIYHDSATTGDGNRPLSSSFPCALIWPPGEPQHFGLVSPWTYSWLHAGGPFLHEMLQQYQAPMMTALPLSPSRLATVERLLTLLQDELQSENPNERILLNTTENIVVSLMRERRDACEGSFFVPAIFTKLKHYIDTHFHEDVTLIDLADHSAMSVSMMRHEFKRFFGLPPIEYLIQVRLRRACELLQNYALRVGDVAAQVGYDDPNTFAIIFRRHIGASPRTYRANMHSETFREQFRGEAHAWELAKLLKEGWELVTDCDFTDASSLEDQWQCEWYLGDDVAPVAVEFSASSLACTADGLEFSRQFRWVQLRWIGPGAEETKLECTVLNTSPYGLNLTISLSGDLQNGYRLRLYGWHQINLETIARGRSEVLQQGKMTLDQHADAYRVTLWRSGNIIAVEIDGQRVLTYCDALPLHGPAHRTFAVGRGLGPGGAGIRRLRAFMRREPRYVDVLEPGRVLLRCGNHEEGAAWFRQVMTTYREPDIVQEAQYLLALAIPAVNRQEKDSALATICAMPTHRFRRQALHDLAMLRADAGEVIAAMAVLQEVAALPQTDDTLRLAFDRLLGHCRVTPDTPILAEVLSALASMPLTILNLSRLNLASLDAIRGLSLTSLRCDRNILTDLTPLCGMPMQLLYCGGNSLSDLTPLRGMPLHSLECVENRITDIEPLTGMSLTTLACSGNSIQNLAPLMGMQLHELNCGQNDITDLTPLQGMPLVSLACNANRITDLAPLHGSSMLRDLYCSENQLTSLEPLRECRLERLACDQNPISDLTPVAGMPLETLACNACSITDLSPLQWSPLRCFLCNDNTIADLTPLAGLPLEELACAHNPLLDLAPLATCPVRQLTIDGIPLTAPNRKVLAALPLCGLSCDLSPAALALLECSSSLTVFNKHTPEHVAQVSPVLFDVLDAWRAGSARPNTNMLRVYADAIDEIAYLALPIQLSRREAINFSEYLGARLVCPSTPERKRAVDQYLTTLMIPEPTKVCYHLGLMFDPVSAGCVWQSDAPYHWQNWISRREEQHAISGGTPLFEYRTTLSSSVWRCGLLPAYLLLEWDNRTETKTLRRI